MSEAVLLMVLGIASGWDVRTRRIPNRLIALGLVLAVGFALWVAGWAGMARAAWGGLVGVSVFFPLFALGWMGAGDAKLFGVVGAFAGASALWPIALYTFIAGGVLALVRLACEGRETRLCERLRNIVMTVWLRLHGVPAPRSAPPMERLPYALAMLAGVLIWMRVR